MAWQHSLYPPLPMNHIPAWKDDLFLALLKQVLLKQRKEQL